MVAVATSKQAWPLRYHPLNIHCKPRRGNQARRRSPPCFSRVHGSKHECELQAVHRSYALPHHVQPTSRPLFVGEVPTRQQYFIAQHLTRYTRPSLVSERLPRGMLSP